MILGTSLAAMGIRPTILNRELAGSGYELPAYNFAFTISYSPYGPPYFASIKRKLMPGTRNGLFILEVNRFAFVERKGAYRLTRSNCPEWERPPASIRFPYLNPNVEYFVRYYHRPFYTLLSLDGKNKVGTLHPNGWFQCKPASATRLPRERTLAKAEGYREKIAKHDPSPLRFDYFERIVDYLKNRGTVVIVYMPIAPELAAVKETFMTDFDVRISQICERHEVPFFNYDHTHGTYETLDGNHLTSAAALRFSRRLARDILLLSSGGRDYAKRQRRKAWGHTAVEPTGPTGNKARSKHPALPPNHANRR